MANKGCTCEGIKMINLKKDFRSAVIEYRMFLAEYKIKKNEPWKKHQKPKSF